MFNLELPWRVAKGAVSAATYRTRVAESCPTCLDAWEIDMAQRAHVAHEMPYIRRHV